jgi:eukaryotic-like serine/threonine-protein kinase
VTGIHQTLGTPEAIAALKKAAQYSSNNPVMLASLGHALAASDDRKGALRVARELQEFRANKGLFAYEIGVIHAALEDYENAFRWFARAVEERSGWIAYLRVDPRLDVLHTDPRFGSLFADATTRASLDAPRETRTAEESRKTKIVAKDATP